MFLMLIVYIYYALTFIHGILSTDSWSKIYGKHLFIAKVLLSEVKNPSTIYVFALFCGLMAKDFSSSNHTFVSWFYDFS